MCVHLVHLPFRPFGWGHFAFRRLGLLIIPYGACASYAPSVTHVCAEIGRPVLESVVHSEIDDPVAVLDAPLDVSTPHTH